MDRYLIKKEKTNEMSSEPVNKNIIQPQPSSSSKDTISVQKEDNIESDSDRCLTPEYKRIKRGEAKYRKHRKQVYSKTWELNPLFSNWLRPDKNSVTNATCIICNITLATEISSLNRHVNSKKHKTNSLSVSNSSSIVQALKPKITPLSKKVKNAEIKITAFLAEHNISFNTMDHFSDLIKTCFPDSEIAKNIHLKRTKTTAIMKNVIGKCHKEYLVKCLREVKFSILTDESTDISCTKQSCVVVRYFNNDIGKIVSHFFELSCVFGPNDHNQNKTFEGATGKNLFNSILKAFNDYDIPLNNLIGFGSDGCNVMMGAHNSVASRMIQNFPGITIWTCICHSLHLCASEACKSLPQRCEELTRSIYSFFSMSSKRNAQFVQFQEFCSTPTHKILHPSQTRW
ncbi:Uncharacterized protein FWK35_00027304, partial [Aphis craccivora]